jgi:hypothetical protein
MTSLLLAPTGYGQRASLDEATATEPSPPPALEDRAEPAVQAPCPVPLSVADPGGRLGPAPPPITSEPHAGLESVRLVPLGEGGLLLVVLAKADIENAQMLSYGDPAPPRSLRAFRFADGQWQDLGSPLDVGGWNVELGSVAAGSPPAISVGLGKDRPAKVAVCGKDGWRARPRDAAEDLESFALLPHGIDVASVYVRRGSMTERAESCPDVGPFGPDNRPVEVAIHLDDRLVPAGGQTSARIGERGDCRSVGPLQAAGSQDALAAAYQLCKLKWGGDYLGVGPCEVETLWYREGTWQRLLSAPHGPLDNNAPFELTLGPEGPLLATSGPNGVMVSAWGPNGWETLPAVKDTDGFWRPLALSSPPQHLTIADEELWALHLDDGSWTLVAPPLPIPVSEIGSRRFAEAAAWIGDTPYVAIGSRDQPVVRVLTGSAEGWTQTLEAVIEI